MRFEPVLVDGAVKINADKSRPFTERRYLYVPQAIMIPSLRELVGFLH